jgi:hypothetical protein
MHWKSPNYPRAKKGCMSLSKFKAMHIVFFDILGVLMAEWVPVARLSINTITLQS